jgi:hypothetical protein
MELLISSEGQLLLSISGAMLIFAAVILREYFKIKTK